MFVIVVYDVNAKRTNKALKICRKYLDHVQMAASFFVNEKTDVSKLIMKKMERTLQKSPSTSQPSKIKG